MTTTLTEALSNLYNIDDDLLIALEAYIRKRFSQGVSEATYKANIEKFIECPNTLYTLLEDVVYDDLGGFSEIDDWYKCYNGYPDEPGAWELCNVENYESDKLYWLKDCSEVDYDLLRVY